MTNDLIATIRSRQTAAAARIAKLRPQLEALERELREYETTLKVLEQVTVSAGQSAASGTSSASTRADNEPTMPTLILQALSSGPKPIADVTASVSSMSDKPIDANNIRSTAWRMWKAGRIAKTGDDYHLVAGPLAPQAEEQDDFQDLI